MGEQRERVLIGDVNQRRVEILQQIIAKEFAVEVVTAKHFDEVKKLVVNSTWNIILIAANLPISPKMGANFRFCFDAPPYLSG